jgi:hypothetical protein
VLKKAVIYAAFVAAITGFGIVPDALGQSHIKTLVVVQNTVQLDGEGRAHVAPQTVEVLEWNPVLK